METIKKEIGYAYSSSVTAKELGFACSGCYYVKLGKNVLQGFTTFLDAKFFADTFPEEYSFWSRKD